MSTMKEARDRVLTAMGRGAKPLASSIGRLAFPDAKFRSAQAAALAAAKLIHTLVGDGLIRYHAFDSGGYEYRLTEAGRAALSSHQELP